MESFVKSLSEDMKQQDLDSEENQFVLALAGIVTSKLMLCLRPTGNVYCLKEAAVNPAFQS